MFKQVVLFLETADKASQNGRWQRKAEKIIYR